MNSSKIYVLLICFFIGLIFPQMIMGNTWDNLQNKISCQEALKNVHLIKVGMKVNEIIDLIGIPTTKSDDRWNYSFWECAPPPKVGSQDIIGVSIVLKENAAAEINWATICATGPGNSLVPKKKLRKKT